MSDEAEPGPPTPDADERAGSTPAIPEPHLVERVIHGQRVWVKVYPPTSDPSWAEWLRFTLRKPLEAPRPGEPALD
jgi:hypothetical protein